VLADLYGVLAEVGHAQGLSHQPTVGDRVGAHSARTGGRQLLELRDQSAALIEQLLGPVATHPPFQELQVIRVVVNLEGDLMGSPEALHSMTVHFGRTGPAFGGPQDDHRPVGIQVGSAGAGLVLDLSYFGDGAFQRRSHHLVHPLRVGAFDQIGLVPKTSEQTLQLIAVDSRQHGWVGDLVSVQMQDGQHRPVTDRIDELVPMPGGRQGTRLGLAIANHCRHDQVRIVKSRSERMGEAVAELPTFVNGARNLGSTVAAEAPGKGEAPEESSQALFVLALFGIDL
jgi:hypothetical protein